MKISLENFFSVNGISFIEVFFGIGWYLVIVKLCF